MVVVGSLGVAGVDLFTGSEVRLYPLYFIPIALAATNFQRNHALLTAVTCAVLWALSNYQAGLHYSSNWIWVWNVLVQGFAFVLVAKLISDLRASKIREGELAREDRLTGLLNARAFHEQAPHLLALCQRDAKPIVMGYIDLDDFKSVNDMQGHQRGDAVLQIAAHIMQSALRSSDLLSRLGGDEFAVLLPNTSAEAASETFERLRRAIELGMRAAGCKVTGSIGAVAYSHAPTNENELIDAADRVMYGVKQSGKNRVQVTKFESQNCCAAS